MSPPTIRCTCTRCPGCGRGYGAQERQWAAEYARQAWARWQLVAHFCCFCERRWGHGAIPVGVRRVA